MHVQTPHDAGRRTLRLAIGVQLLAAMLVAGAPHVVRAQAVTDSARVDRLVTELRDTSTEVRSRARAEFAASGRQLVPTLMSRVGSRDGRAQYGAVAGLVLVGEPARPELLRMLRDDDTHFLVSESFGVIESADELLAFLDPWLRDKDADVRAFAVELLDGYREDALAFGPAILRALHDESPKVREAAVAVHYTQIPSRDLRRAIAEVLVAALPSADAGTRRSIVYNLGNMTDVSAPAIPSIIARMERDPEIEVRWLSARVLGWYGAAASSAVPALLGRLNDRADTVRFEAIDALGAIGVSKLSPELAGTVIDTLTHRLAASRPAVRAQAAEALARIGAPAHASLVIALASTDGNVARIGAEGLAALVPDSSVDAPLLRALRDPRTLDRIPVAVALAGIGPRIVEPLREIERAGPAAVTESARLALRLLEDGNAYGVADRCYRIEQGPWEPPLRARTIEGTVPPTRIRFRRVIAGYDAAGDRGPTRFAVDLRGDEAWFQSGLWYRDEKGELHVDPSPSLSGIRYTLRPDASGALTGRVTAYWDYREAGRVDESAPAHLTPITCDAPLPPDVRR